MHRPEFIDGGIGNNTPQTASNSGGDSNSSYGSIISFNTLLSSGGTNSNNSSNDPSFTTAADIHRSSIFPIHSQPYNASFQGISVSSSPRINDNQTQNSTTNETLYLLESGNLSSQSPNEVSRVFQYWRSFLDPTTTSHHPSNQPSMGRSTSQSPGTSSVSTKSSRTEEAKKKYVYQLVCTGCASVVSDRAMRSKLLADASCILYSTDSPMSRSIGLLDADYRTISCNCLLRDIACLTCGGVIGYHVSHPCESCLSRCNNGHIWLFNSNAIHSTPILNHKNEPLSWYHLLFLDHHSKGKNSPKLQLENYICR